jgi:hypothetical protein
MITDVIFISNSEFANKTSAYSGTSYNLPLFFLFNQPFEAHSSSSCVSDLSLYLKTQRV